MDGKLDTVPSEETSTQELAVWSYRNPVDVRFGQGSFSKLGSLLNGRAYVLVTYGEAYFRSLASDLAKTACVVDVHWRGGPIRRSSTFEVSAILTISVAGIPGLTTTSMSHHECASGGIAANNSVRISDGDGLGSVITHMKVTCP